MWALECVRERKRPDVEFQFKGSHTTKRVQKTFSALQHTWSRKRMGDFSEIIFFRNVELFITTRKRHIYTDDICFGSMYVNKEQPHKTLSLSVLFLLLQLQLFLKC